MPPDVQSALKAVREWLEWVTHQGSETCNVYQVCEAKIERLKAGQL